MEDDLGGEQPERLQEPPRALQSDPHQVRAASRDEQHGLAERPTYSQRRTEGARVVRGPQALDPGERERSTEGPALAQDDARPSDPMLREQPGERDQDEVSRQ